MNAPLQALMFGLGGTELVIVVLIVLAFIGWRRLPEIGQSVGSALREFKRESRPIREVEAEVIDVDEPSDDAQVDEDSEASARAGAGGGKGQAAKSESPPDADDDDASKASDPLQAALLRGLARRVPLVGRVAQVTRKASAVKKIIK